MMKIRLSRHKPIMREQRANDSDNMSAEADHDETESKC